MDRFVGTGDSGEIARARIFGGEAIQRAMTFERSVAGNGAAAYSAEGMSLTIGGGAQDGAAKTALGGTLTVMKAPNADGAYVDGSVGKCFAYGAQRGRFLVQGGADARAGIRLSGADVVIGGDVKGFAFEYMTGGRAAILGDPGRWICSGMSGGAVFVRHDPERGLDEATTLAGFRDLGRWLDEYQRAQGHPGFDRVGWLEGTVRGTLIELGRLQCNCASWHGAVRVFRHRRDRRVQLLMTGRHDLRADGWHQGIAGLAQDPAGWTTSFSEGPEGWRGSPVDARGRAQRAEVLLPADDWEAALAPGDPVWYVHIPASGPLLPEACRDSLLAHRAKLPLWFPGHQGKAFISVSWMFDAQLADHLPADANLVRFLRAFHLHPHRDVTGDQIKERVLGRSGIDWRTCTPTSSLQRAVLAHYRAGGTWAQSGAVLFPDEIETAFATA